MRKSAHNRQSVLIKAELARLNREIWRSTNMDPNACYDRWIEAVEDNEWVEARSAHQDLTQWLNRGGFEPFWTAEQKREFLAWTPSKKAG